MSDRPPNPTGGSHFHYRNNGNGGTGPGDRDSGDWNTIYDSTNKLQALVALDGGRASLAYDRFNRPTHIVFPGGCVPLQVNDPSGNSAASANGHEQNNGQSHSYGCAQPASRAGVPATLRVPLLLLKLGYEYARRLGSDLWWYSASVALLDSVGLPRWELESLLADGLAVCRNYDAARGKWAPVPGTSGISLSAYVVLTDAGAKFATQVFEEAPISPRYAANEASLYVENVLVKCFQNSASGQEPILEQFESSRWPGGISVVGEFQPNGSAIDWAKNMAKKLNLNHLVPLIHFGSRSGNRITWEFLVPHGPGPTSAPV